MNSNLNSFLEQKSLYYDKIDFSVVKTAWDILSNKVKLPFVIHIVGTNGKGSTGRFLAHYLHKSGHSVLHYSSPHILAFNERIWINGSDISDELLDEAHETLQSFLPNDIVEKLTYFEYTTLVALLLSSNKEFLVLEAGLGGEFDATNVVKNNLSLITPIGLDHQEFLGNSIKEIATTKLKACDSFMILAKQPHSEVYEVAKDYSFEKAKEFDTMSVANIPNYLHRNLDLVLTALEFLKIKIDLKLFEGVKLFGRYQKLKPNITIDVGHNSLAANVIFEELQNLGKKVSLVYNSFKDKDYKEILKTLAPCIDEVLILNFENKRLANKEDLVKVCRDLKLKVNDFYTIDNQKEYLVFGSFLVVENFLNKQREFIGEK